MSNARRAATANRLARQRRQDAPEPAAAAWHRSRGMLFALFAASGFAGLIYESIWTHYLKLFLGHAAYAQTLVLAIFMGGLALGSWLSSRWSARWRDLLVAYAGKRPFLLRFDNHARHRARACHLLVYEVVATMARVSPSFVMAC